jgi:hypothetical protein
VIFSRGRRGRHSRDDDARPSDRHTAGSGPLSDDDARDTDESPGAGPYDVSEAPSGVERIDLGSLQIPAVDGVEVRVQASQDGTVQQVVLVHGDSALQLGVFAAPRSAGIWDEVRAELRGTLANAQSVRESDGPYGTELRARVRAPEGQVDLRFLGVDGPRWMVQALYQGRAATDPAAAGPLTECLEGLVVDRGKEAMPVREPLPLRLPRDVAEQATQAGDPETRAAALPGPDAAPHSGPVASLTVGAGPTIGRGPGAPAADQDAGTGEGVNGQPPRDGARRGSRPKPSPRPRRST